MSYSITFGDVVETHAGMEQTGEMASEGFSIQLLEEIAKANPWDSELVYLHEQLPDTEREGNAAAVLILRQGIELLGPDPEELLEEISALELDKMAVFRGQVKNKRARWNLCFADSDQEPDYAAGKGRIISFAKLPHLSRVRQKLAEVLGPEAKDLLAELNFYYDLKQCGIGFHGDTERKKVVCLRLGESNPLEFQWFHRSRPVGARIQLQLESGDLYLMSQKAVGGDWKKSSLFTLRHAAGAPKYRKTKYD